MSKITSKLQVTIPKEIAKRHGLSPGDEIEWVSAGETIRVTPRRRIRKADDTAARLKLFDEAMARQKKRDAAWGKVETPKDRGWKREDLYVRGRPR